MDDLYQWLFDHYALPELRDTAEEHDDALSAFAERAALTRIQRLRLIDMVSNMRLEWGPEAFALGVRFGLGLHVPRARSREPGWLMDFLP